MRPVFVITAAASLLMAGTAFAQAPKPAAPAAAPAPAGPPPPAAPCKMYRSGLVAAPLGFRSTILFCFLRAHA